MAMTVDNLKSELEARNELKSGNKAWLRRRLHAPILRARMWDELRGDSVQICSR